MAAYHDHWHTTADGLRLYVRDYRNDHAPFAVLCLHGLTRNSADFEELADVLAPDYRVLVMEQRGRGQSDYDANPDNYQLGTYVQDALGLLDSLGLDDVALIGTSMGGLMSMTMTAMSPQRFRGLVLNDIGPVVEAAGLARIQGYVGRGGPVTTWDDAVAAARANNEVAFPDFTDAEWLAFARRLFRKGEGGRPELAYDPAISQPMNRDTASAVPPDMWSLFDQITAKPMLVIRGELSDILSSATVAEMARRKPDLESVDVPRRGHAPLLSEPEAERAIVRFLRQL